MNRYKIFNKNIPEEDSKLKFVGQVEDTYNPYMIPPCHKIAKHHRESRRVKRPLGKEKVFEKELKKWEKLNIVRDSFTI